MANSGHGDVSTDCPPSHITGPTRRDRGCGSGLPSSSVAGGDGCYRYAVVSLSVRAEMDNELEQAFVEVGSLPTMVTPICDPDGALRMTPAECPVIVAPGVSSCVIQPFMASSPVGPHVGSPGFSHPSTGSMGDLLGNRSSPVVSAPEGFLLSHAADLNQAQPEADLLFTGPGGWPVSCYSPDPGSGSCVS